MEHCNAKQTLQQAGIKITKGRLELMETIIGATEPFTVSELHARNSQQTDLATVYRLVKVLFDHRILRIVAQNNETVYYEMECEHHPNHPHFLCRKCHRITCLSTIKSTDLLQLARYASDESVEDVSVSYSGICKTCRSKGENLDV